MILSSYSSVKKSLETISESYDIVITGGGLTGVCAALTAAREGASVCLIQDRPVLGGNASSEVRVWALGATSHMGNNNRWSREGGVINEILTENLYRNKEGNPILFDMVLIDKVLAEKNITLHLNTSVFDIEKTKRRITSVTAFNSSSEKIYNISGKYFIDCSGDGVVAYLAGASYRMGSEDAEQYGEGFAKDKEMCGELMGDTIFFYMKDTGKPVKYEAPDFALKDVESYIEKLSNRQYFSTSHHGCRYWWLEYGGRLDTVHDTEKIKFELWKVVYGIWDYIKNSGKFPEMETYTLEWVGLIPGKRESRRFVGEYTLTQSDIVNQSQFVDAVSYGGWAVDLHPADGVYAPGKGCNQLHSKGVYQIPLRCYISPEIENLMFGGRIASSSHIANGSIRVMCTCAHGGQAIGAVAALCIRTGLKPKDYSSPEHIKELQTVLERRGQYIPGVSLEDPENKLKEGKLSVSSEYMFSGFEADAGFRRLQYSTALIFPAVAGKLPEMKISLKSDVATEIELQLRRSSKSGNFTPDVILETRRYKVNEGNGALQFSFDTEMDRPGYVFVCVMKNESVEIGVSESILPGVMTVLHQVNPAVSNYGAQIAPDGSGFESFEFWCPQRRPEAKNLAISFSKPVEIYKAENILSPIKRPTDWTNCWVCSPDDKCPEIKVAWAKDVEINSLTLFFDGDYDNAMESVQMGHYDNVPPLCVQSFKVFAGEELIAEVKGNHQPVCEIVPKEAVITSSITIRLDRPFGSPASLYNIIIS